MSTQCSISWRPKGLLFFVAWAALVDYSQQQFGDYNDFEDDVGGDTVMFPQQHGSPSLSEVLGADLDVQLQQGQRSKPVQQFGQQPPVGGPALFGQPNQLRQPFGQQFGVQRHFRQPAQVGQQLQPNDQLVFSNGGSNIQRPPTAYSSLLRFTTPPPPFANRLPNPNQNFDKNQNAPFVFINNRPTVATMAPFISSTTPTPAFMNCFSTCPTTSEYNPICGSDQQLYQNEQKFNCAVRCGAAIQIVRRGSCMGLFPMTRG